MTQNLTIDQFADCLMQIMPRFVRAMWHYEKDSFARGVITLPQLWALEYLCRREGCTMRELARAMKLGESTITGLVDRLVRQRFVQRVRSRKDRRVVHVVILPKGRKLIEEIAANKKKAIVRFFSALPSKYRIQYLTIIQKIVENIDSDNTSIHALSIS